MLARMLRNWIIHTLFVGEWNATATVELVWQLLINLDMQKSDDPAITALGIYARETKTEVDAEPVLAQCSPQFYFYQVKAGENKPTLFYQANG